MKNGISDELTILWLSGGFARLAGDRRRRAGSSFYRIHRCRNTTELFRKIIIDGMDVFGGNSISLGPRNAPAHAYINAPIGVTVEGANILTRTLMIFGQGAIRSHPFVMKEINALREKNAKEFDAAFWGHVGMVFRNLIRFKLLSITRGRLASSPVSGPTAKYFRKLAWVSAMFSFLTDVTLFALGGELKRMEKLAGRFADIFSWMYLSTAVLRRFEADGRPKQDLPFVRWNMMHAFSEMQRAFEHIFATLKIPGCTWILRGSVAAWVRINRLSGEPDDETGHEIAIILQTPGPQRDRLTEGIFIPSDENWPPAKLDWAMALSLQAEPISGLLKKAVREGLIKRDTVESMLEQALAQDLVSEADAGLLRKAEAVREDTIQVDAFMPAEYGTGAVDSDEIDVNIERFKDPEDVI